MSIQAAALHKAVASVWSSSGLENGFKQYWPTADKTKYLSLNDGEASPGTPFPYCVFETSIGTVTNRMSGGRNRKYIIRDIPWMFHIFATETQDKSAKEYAAFLAEALMMVYGGIPGLIKPQQLTMDNGSAINMQFSGDYGLRVGDSEHRWTVEYLIKTDQPIAVI